MEYLLILTMFHGGITVVSERYETRELCELTGSEYVESTKNQIGDNQSAYFCTSVLGDKK